MDLDTTAEKKEIWRFKMFNKNTFLQHTTNTTNHNKMTRAGVKAPFSMNEQAFVFPIMYSGDQRPDVSRTGSPGRRDLGGMVGQAGNQVAAKLAAKNQNRISSLFDTHVHNAYQSGIDTHGHWDITEKDANAIIKPHFSEYFEQVKSIDPNANRESHYQRFDAAVTEKGAKLQGWGQSPTMNEQSNLENRFDYKELLPSLELMVPNYRKEYDGANMPRTQSGDTRTDVPRTGSPGKNNPVIKMNPTERQATPYDEEFHTDRHTNAIESNQEGNLYRKHDPMGFHIDRAVEQWRNSGSRPGEPSDVNKMDIARGHFHNYVQDLTRNGEFNQMYRPNMDMKSSFYKTHFNQFMQGMDVAHREMEPSDKPSLMDKVRGLMGR